MKRILLMFNAILFLLAFLSFREVQAQTIQVKGIVKETNGNPVPGVSVQSMSLKQITITNEKGEFGIKAAGKDTLILSSIGFSTKRIAINGASTLKVTLIATSNELDQIVVVGYGTQRKRDLSGAITTVGAEEIGGRRTVQVSDALQGAIAGVTVTRSSGEPGSSASIRFRGITTIGNNNPLYVVDGVPYNDIDRLNPNDIESITALKDAASASIYGSRAAAGVLLITTKRAKTGQSSLEYNYEFGVQQPTRLPSYAGVVDYLTLYNEFLSNDGSAPIYSKDYINNYLTNNATNPDGFPNVNWQNSVLGESAPRQIHDLAFTIGTEKIKSRVSLGYSDTKALYANKSFQKLSGTINNDLNINDKLNAKIDLSLIRTNNFSTTANPLVRARVLPPIYNDIYQDGRYAPSKDGDNPLAEINKGGYINNLVGQIQGRAMLNYKPITGLTISGLVSPTYTNNRESTWNKRIDFTDVNDASRIISFNRANTSLKESRPYAYSFNGQLLANYTKTFNGNHNLDFLAGYEDNYYYNEYLTATRGSFDLINFPYLDDGSTALRDNSGGASESSLRSYFGRLKYDYKNKYYIQGNLRDDGSSRFNAKNRWALFPSVSGAWTVSEEKFFRDLKFISFMKARASWGQAGNERIGNYPYQANITFNNSLFYNNGKVVPATSGGQIAYAIPDISWETQETFDAGLDINFLGNKLSITADYYHKQTKNILLSLDIPLYMGYERPAQNAGVVSAKGWELSANWNDEVGALKYSLGMNMSDSKTKIVDLKGTQQLGSQANIQGGEFNSWYGYQSAGLFQTAKDVAGSAVLNSNTMAGDVKYIDQNGDGKITPDKDQVLLGGSLPRYIFGINAHAEYKRFEFSFVVQGVAKQLSSSSENNSQVKPFLEGFGNVPTIILGNFWSLNNTPEANQAAIYPRLSRKSDSNNYQMSDFYLINGAYLRVKNITLTYNFSDKLSRKLGTQGLRFYIAGNDLFTLSHFPTGLDPENSATSYPMVRTLLAGLNVKF